MGREGMCVCVEDRPRKSCRHGQEEDGAEFCPMNVTGDTGQALGLSEVSSDTVSAG